jgi:hypothetical protein
MNAGEPVLETSPPALSRGPHRRQQHTVAIIRVPRSWYPGARSADDDAQLTPAPAPVSIADPADGLDAFGSEFLPGSGGGAVATFPSPMPLPEPASEKAEVAKSRVNWRPTLVALKWTAVVALSAIAAVGAQWAMQRRQAAAATGSIRIETTPVGAEVTVDGRPSGVTPLTLTLAPATYAVEVKAGAQQRSLRIEVAPGTSVVQHLEMPVTAGAVAAATGSLHVQTEPAGQMVSIAGTERGISPLTVDNLPPGQHTITVRGPKGIMRRTVGVKAGETMSLLVAAPAAAAADTPLAGWLSVQSPTRLELREGGKLIGTTETEKIMLPAGKHQIEIINEAVGYRSTREIEVLSNKTSTVAVELPFGAVSINAQPWAEVWIGGERIGDTPIANLQRRIGQHEVVFRHPQLGERRETILVTLRQPVRLGVDMRSR